MDDLSSLTTFGASLTRVLSELGTGVATFAPRLLAAALVLGLGWLLARAVEAGTARVLRAVGLDSASVRLGITRVDAGDPPSELLGRLLFWLSLGVALLASVDLLGLATAASVASRVESFVPTLAGAALVAGIGAVAVRAVGAIVVSAVSTAGWAGARRIGLLVRVGAAGLVTVVVCEQLGIATEVLVAPLTGVVAAAALSAGLAFALGARPIITHILAGHFLKQSLPRDSFVEVSGERGLVERIGATDTLLRNGERRWSVPNGQLLEQVVVR